MNKELKKLYSRAKEPVLQSQVCSSLAYQFKKVFVPSQLKSFSIFHALGPSKVYHSCCSIDQSRRARSSTTKIVKALIGFFWLPFLECISYWNDKVKRSASTCRSRGSVLPFNSKVHWKGRLFRSFRMISLKIFGASLKLRQKVLWIPPKLAMRKFAAQEELRRNLQETQEVEKVIQTSIQLYQEE